MSIYIHPNSLCQSLTIGTGTRIWAFVNILKGAQIGSDCNICDHVFIENDVIVGNNVTIKCGVQLWDGITLEDDVFIGPNVTFTNDLFPRSKQYPTHFKKTLVRRGASIGANATILPGLTIGMFSMIGAGSLVADNVPPFAIVVGNPARIVGYTNSSSKFDDQKSIKTPSRQIDDDSKQLLNEFDQSQGVLVYELPAIKDLRGSLTVGEFEKTLPFVPKRYFLVFDVPSNKVRGEHAHRQCHQFLVCIKGSCSVVVDDGASRREILLDRPNKGIHIPPMVWGVQYKYSADAVLLVFASEYYDENDYIRDYDDFIKHLN